MSLQGTVAELDKTIAETIPFFSCSRGHSMSVVAGRPYARRETSSLSNIMGSLRAIPRWRGREIAGSH